MVAIVDYGMGNVASVQKALDYLKIDNVITNDYHKLNDADAYLMPGVGSFGQGMKNLQELHLIDTLNEMVMVKKKPFMGICLGMQLIASIGYEPNECKGLGWVEGEVKLINSPTLPIPHMGWNNITCHKKEYYNDIDNFDFYFVHSYEYTNIKEDLISSTVDYGTHIVAAIQKDNIFATQFHPEKSQKSGLQLISNFYKSC